MYEELNKLYKKFKTKSRVFHYLIGEIKRTNRRIRELKKEIG